MTCGGRSWAGPERGSEILCVLTHGMGSTPPPPPPPPLDLSTLQFRSDLHGIPKPGNETQLSDILSVSQVSVRANRQEFFKSRELLHIASNSQKISVFAVLVD